LFQKTRNRPKGGDAAPEGPRIIRYYNRLVEAVVTIKERRKDTKSSTRVS